MLHYSPKNRATYGKRRGRLPRKGGGNAILTYETVAEIDTKLTQVSAQLDYLFEGMATREAEHKDHVVRLRALARRDRPGPTQACCRSDRDRQMVEILAAVLSDGLHAVEAACADALRQGVHSADVIINMSPPPMAITSCRSS